MYITEKRTQTILNGLQDKHCLESCSKYGELGYTNPEKGILFANWNDISKPLQDYLEESGFELEWSDEWYIDYDNDKAWRTSPDSYGWICALGYGDGYVLTPDDDISEWLELCEITDHNQPIRALPDFITQDNLSEQGYVQHNGRFESGFHHGQNDDPSVISKDLFDSIDDIESVVFRISNAGQFDIHFEAFYKVGE